MSTLKLGMIGVGHMAGQHMVNIRKNPRIEVVAICDRDPAVMARFDAPGARAFPDTRSLLDSGLADAVMVCTHHSDHLATGMAVLESGVHLLMEKPLALSKGDCEKLVAAHRDPRQVFAIMLNQRTDPRFRWAKELIDAGDFGSLMRVQWTITDWFRTDYYFELTPWFAKWSDGGGLVMTQALHQLDILIWLCGKPTRVRSFAHLGKWHDVAVDDDVTAYMEFENGATGVFVTSTGETPGCNRLELSGDKGRIVIENDSAVFHRLPVPASVMRRTVRERTIIPEIATTFAEDTGRGGQHGEILDNFVEAVLDGAPLIAHGSEGLLSVELANAILMSSVREETVALPMDSELYARTLAEMIAAEAP